MGYFYYSKVAFSLFINFARPYHLTLKKKVMSANSFASKHHATINSPSVEQLPVSR